MGILFGTAGPPLSAAAKSTEAGIKRVAELGLGCMEIEFVQGVKMGEETAARVRAASAECGIRLSCHAPYFINLASGNSKIVEASMERLYQAARVGRLCGAGGVVFHPGFYQDCAPPEAFKRIVANTKKVLRRMEHDNIKGIILRPELTGKPGQFGSPEEILALCAETGGLPCVDFSHLYARTLGECNSLSCFSEIVGKIGETLGAAAVKNFHAHLSGIEFGPKGERRHVPVKECGLKYRDVIRALADAGAEGTVICESPEEFKEKDALLYHKYYRRIRKAG